MKKMMMMVVVAAFTLAANAQTPCKDNSCSQHNSQTCPDKQHCDENGGVCAGDSTVCATACKPVHHGKAEDCKTACSKKAKDCHTSKHCATDCKEPKHHHAKAACKTSCSK